MNLKIFTVLNLEIPDIAFIVMEISTVNIIYDSTYRRKVSYYGTLVIPERL